MANGFGCPVAVVWRGYGGPSWPSGDTVRWRGPDGASCLLYHLPPSGYEFGSHLPSTDDAEARLRRTELHDVLVARSSLGITLLPHGADHHAPQPRQEEAIAALERAFPEERLVRSSLAAFGQRLQERAAARALPIVDGELRDSYGYAWTLQGTLGVRASLKRRNALAERLLLRDMEPWAAIARHRDGCSRRHLLNAAWRSLLMTHPHDTLCGCSVDEVARAMGARLEAASSAAAGVRDEAIDSLLGHDPVAARARSAEWTPVVVVRNRSARRRAGVAEVEIDVVLAEAPVGPGAGGGGVPSRTPGMTSLGDPPVALQLLRADRLFAREESPRHYPRNRLIERRRVLAWVDAVPAFGMRVLPLHEGKRRRPRAPEGARAGAAEIENASLRVALEHGALTLVSSDGRVCGDFFGFEAEGERGDLYTHSPIPGSRVDGRMVRWRITRRGPLRAEIDTRWELQLAARTLSTAVGEPRAVPPVRLQLRALIQLDAGASFARILIASDSRATDLRLRLRVRTGLRAPQVFADAAFGAVERVTSTASTTEAAIEARVLTAPLHRFVSLGNDERGVTVFSDGLAEYEVGGTGEVFITLARAVGELSRNNLSERPGHAGWPVETPEAQLVQPIRAMIAVMPHGARRPALISHLESVADDVLVPLIGHTWRTAVSPPTYVDGVQLVGRGLACTAIKESEDGEWIVLRCVNLLPNAVTGAWRAPGVREAWLARLDEQPLGARVVQNGLIAFEAPPQSVLTFLVR
jgi:hypothetical protein